MIDLTGKRAVITGAASGVGAATAATFARIGAAVTVADIDADGAEAVAEQIRSAGGTAISVAVDVADEDQVAEMIARTKQEFGGIDILHNNAAALSNDILGQDRDLADMTVELWDRTHSVNLRGVMFGCKHVMPSMLEQGAGCIINTASTAGQAGDIVRSAYGASKAGVEMFTKYVATMYGHRGIRANAVAPGLVMSPIALANLDPAASARFRRGRLIERAGTPDDIASMVAYLASDLAGFITGQVFNVDGGVLAHAPSYADNLGEF